MDGASQCWHAKFLRRSFTDEFGSRDGSVATRGLSRASTGRGASVARTLVERGQERYKRGMAKDVAIMSEISNIGMSNSYAAGLRNLSNAPTGQGSRAGQSEGIGETDPVEFSRMGRMLAATTDASSMRQAKIQALRAQIADGTFETPERISGTVDRLMKELQ